MLLLPPLESLRFFEAAARHQSFARAAEELDVTPGAVAHRVRMLEKHLEVPLFDRRRRGVRVNRRGRAYLKEVQRILAEVHGVSERQRRWPRRVRIVSVEAVAEKWLMPRLATFKAAHPGVAIELETNHRGVDPDRGDFDAWLAYSGETAAPRPVTRREDTLLEETLYEEDLMPVCSPALLAAPGRPLEPADLQAWPLLYDLGWDADWAYPIFNTASEYTLIINRLRRQNRASGTTNALKPAIWGGIRRSSCGPLRERDRCPGRRRWPSDQFLPAWPCGRARSARPHAGRSP